MREGKPSTRHPGMGVRVICLGPNSTVPGERLRLVIYDEQDKVVRRLEQIKGECVDEGYADFFDSHLCGLATFLTPLVDIAPDGSSTILHPDFKPHHMHIWRDILKSWVDQHGIPQEIQ